MMNVAVAVADDLQEVLGARLAAIFHYLGDHQRAARRHQQ